MKKVLIILLSLALVAGVTVAIIFGVKSCNSDGSNKDSKNIPFEYTIYKDEYTPTPQKTTLEENEIAYDLFTNEGEELFAYANDDLGKAMDVNYNSEMNGFLIKYDKAALLDILNTYNQYPEYKIDSASITDFTISIPKDSKKSNEVIKTYEDFNANEIKWKIVNDGILILNQKNNGSLLINPDLNDYDTTDSKLVNYSDPALRVFIKNISITGDNFYCPSLTWTTKLSLNPNNADGYMFKFHYVKSEMFMYNTAVHQTEAKKSNGETYTTYECITFINYYKPFAKTNEFAYCQMDSQGNLAPGIADFLKNNSMDCDYYKSAVIEGDFTDVEKEKYGIIATNSMTFATVQLDGADGFDKYETYRAQSANDVVETFVCYSIGADYMAKDATYVIAGDASNLSYEDAKALTSSLPGKYW